MFRCVFLYSYVYLSIALYSCVQPCTALYMCTCIAVYLDVYTPISKNVVGENGEWQLSNGNCTTERNCGFYIWYAKTMSSSGVARLDGNKNPTNLHI